MCGTCLAPDLNKRTAQKTFETLEELEHWVFDDIKMLLNFSYDNDFMEFFKESLYFKDIY